MFYFQQFSENDVVGENDRQNHILLKKFLTSFEYSLWLMWTSIQITG